LPPESNWSPKMDVTPRRHNLCRPRSAPFRF
jgi:hypothetical protein